MEASLKLHQLVLNITALIRKKQNRDMVLDSIILNILYGSYQST